MLSTLSKIVTRHKPLNPLPENRQKQLQQQPQPLSTLHLSQNIHKMILHLYGEYINDDGTAVNYTGIKQSNDFVIFQETTLLLHTVDLEVMSEVERKVFFINLYNCGMIHSVTLFGSPTNMVTRMTFFAEVGYYIGPYFYTLNDIEHGILRNNGTNPILGTPQFSSSDPRKRFAVPLDPRIHFALVCGAKSCPPIRIFSVQNLDRGLDAAAKNFCHSHVTIQLMSVRGGVDPVDQSGSGAITDGSGYVFDSSDSTVSSSTSSASSAVRTGGLMNWNVKSSGVGGGCVTVSPIFKWYASDFGKTPENILKFILKYVEEDVQKQIEEVLLKEGFLLKYEEYDWRVNSSM